MATREVLELIIKGDAKGAIDAFRGSKDAADKAGDSTEKATGKIGQAFSKIADKYPMVGKAAERFGISAENAGTVAAAGATAAAGAIGAFALKSVQAFQETAGAILKFQRISGMSAEESSKWVEVTGDYGLSAEQAAASVGKFAKTVGTTPEVLAKYGVQVERNADGTVNLEKTLLNASDAFASSTDETERAALGAALFGKSWQDMVPLLEKGGKQLEETFNGVASAKILSEEDLKMAEDFRLTLDDLKDVGEGVMIQFGKGLVPVLKDAADNMAELTDAANALTTPLGGIGETINKVNTAAKFLSNPLRAVTTGLDEVRDAGQRAADALTGQAKKTQDLRDAHKQVADAIAKNRVEHEELIDTLGSGAEATKVATLRQRENADITEVEADRTKEINDLLAQRELAQKRATNALRDNLDEVRASADATFALARAERDTKKAADEYAIAVAKSGQESDAAAEAADKLKQDLLDQADAYAKQTGAAEGSRANMEAQRAKLVELRDQYAARFPEIAAYIQQYIDKLNEAAAAATRVQVPGFEARTRAPGGAIVQGVNIQPGTFGADRASGGTGGATVNIYTLKADAQIGQVIIDAIKAAERANGTGWRSS